MANQKIKAELISTGDSGWSVPMEMIDLCDGFEYGVHGAYEAWTPSPVGSEFKGESYVAQAGKVSGNPNAGKGSM